MKPKPLSATVSVVAVTLALAGCAGKSATPTNASTPMNLSITSANTSPENASATTTTNAPESAVSSDHPASLHVVKTKKLSLQGIGAHLGQGTYNPQFAPDFLNQQEGFIDTPKGLMYTPNGGHSWRGVSSPAGTIEALKFTTPQKGWAITRTGPVNSTSSRTTFSIYRTTNAGSRWTKQWHQQSKDDISGDRIFNFGDHGCVVVAANQLLKQSNSSSWSRIHLPITGSVANADFVTAQKGWAVVEQTQKAVSPDQGSKHKLVVLHTTDGGAHWHVQLRTPAFAGGGSGVKISFRAASDGLLLYKNIETMKTTAYRTTNGGVSWQKSVPTKLSGRRFAGRPVFASGGSVWIPLSAGAAPFASSVLESNDMGKTWNTVTAHGEWRMLKLGKRFGNTAYLVAGLSQGYAVLKTTNNGKRWKQILPDVAPARSISFVSSTLGYALGTKANSDVVLKTTNGGQTWSTVGVLPNGTHADNIAFKNEKVGYITIPPTRSTNKAGNTVVMETQDGGKTWTTAPFGNLPKHVLRGMHNGGSIVEPAYIHPPSQVNGQDWVLGATGYPKLYTFTGGTHGSVIDATFLDPPGAIEDYSFLSPTDGWMSVLKTQKSGSTNGQSTIQQLDSKTKQWIPKWTLPTGWSIEGMYRLNAEDAWLFVQKPWTSMHPTIAVYRTTDGGQNWTRYEEAKGPDLMAPPAAGSAEFPVDFVNTNDGWLLTQEGLLKTTDGGAVWTRIS